MRAFKAGYLVAVIAGLCVMGGYSHVHGADALGVTAGELYVEPPTLINLGFEWVIEGDQNRNASVEVSYRRVGSTAWLAALPLMRLNGERIKQGQQIDVTAPNMFAGSILDLEPATEYEARFVMKDADGVTGQASKTVRIRTRPEPVPSTGGKTYHVSSDYNGFRPNAGAAVSFAWNSPPDGVMSDFSGLAAPPPGGAAALLQQRRFTTLAEYSQATGQDRHSIAVDYDIFVNVPALNAQDLSTVQRVYKPELLDFALKPTAIAVDKGVALPNVNTNFAGRAPDLGALEVGRPAPRFGPRR